MFMTLKIFILFSLNIFFSFLLRLCVVYSSQAKQLDQEGPCFTESRAGMAFLVFHSLRAHLLDANHEGFK